MLWSVRRTGGSLTSLDNVAAAYMESGWRSPIVNSREKTHLHIEHQTRGYRCTGPATKHEKALPPIVFRHQLKQASLPRELARAHLVCGALFFAMHSCEYTYVGTGERKTRSIRVCDIIFRNGGAIIPHGSPNLHLAESVSINFGEQKSEVKDETVSQDNNNAPDLNPVIHWAFTVKRLRSYPGFDNKWEVFTFCDKEGTFIKIPSKENLLDLHCSVDSIGKDESQATRLEPTQCEHPSP